MTKDITTLDQTAFYEVMNDVVSKHLEGQNPSQIAKSLNIRRADVLTYIEDFKRIAKDNDLLQARAKEVVHEFDQQHNRIIAELWDVSRDAEDKGDIKTRATVLKSLSDVTAKRVEVLQKSGLLSDAALGDEMAELEEKQEKLIGILRDVTAHCNKCKMEVARRLSQITGGVETIIVDEQV